MENTVARSSIISSLLETTLGIKTVVIAYGLIKYNNSLTSSDFHIIGAYLGVQLFNEIVNG